MIKIENKESCCGCAACSQVCPKGCISMNQDKFGFLYPQVEMSDCIKCGLCEKVCPCLNQNESKRPLRIYSAINENEKIRYSSSSGGVFSLLAEIIISRGGVVFGACFDESWNVVHSYAETIEEIDKFRGSKYVQSRIGDSYITAKAFLDHGRTVLFSGTPCQITGLKRYLRKDYDNLFTIDVVCHGVPSPLVWRKYLEYVTKPAKRVDGKNTVLLSLNAKPGIAGISFRDKRKGWQKFGFSVHKKVACGDQNSVFPSIEDLYESVDKNVYLQTFIRNIDLRPSCCNCPSRSGKSGSDITLADFWAIEKFNPSMYDGKGTSMVLIHSIKGQSLFDDVSCKKSEQSYNEAFYGNRQIAENPKMNYYSEKFWKLFLKYGFKKVDIYYKMANPTLRMRIIKKILDKLF